MKNKITIVLLTLFAFLCAFRTDVYASTPTDEIINYDITVNVNEDATLRIDYHIEWEVLESDSAGPLSWVQVGIPNSHYVEYGSTSPTISEMSITSSGGYYARIDFDRNYYEGEVVNFDFYVIQDNMYQVDKFTEGQTVYDFTPGWFDDIKVDTLTINWNCDKAIEWTPYCAIEDGYCNWVNSLDPGEKYTVSVTYPNDAFAFDLSKTVDNYEDDDAGMFESIFVILGIIISLATSIAPIVIIFLVIKSIGGYVNGANLGGTEKKVTRTKVTYYPSCQGCGAVRKDGEQFCTYCGRSFVKSEEIIKEEDIKAEDKDILKYKSDGEFRYAAIPNTYIRVHTTRVARPTPPRSSSSHSSSHHSSCAHSSCACACACACAGGGRAGCTNKDFYNTDLKLKQLERKIGRKNG